jgi:hypothetical protein
MIDFHRAYAAILKCNLNDKKLRTGETTMNTKHELVSLNKNAKSILLYKNTQNNL